MESGIIVLDAGHGGQDAGVTSPSSPPYEAVEKWLTLDIATQLRRALNGIGWPLTIGMTRDTDVDLPLHARGSIAKKLGAKLVISLHVNSSPDPKVSGLMTFCWPGNKRMRAMGTTIARCAPDALRRPSSLCWEATNDPSHDDDWLIRARNVLGSFECDALLVELAHMTNVDDRAEILSAEVQRGAVAAIVAGVAHWMAG